MFASIPDFALLIGIVLGAIMLLGVIYVYVKNQSYGMGGTALTVFGTLLIGLSIWKTAEISISPDGGLQAKFEALEKRFITVKQETEQQLNENDQQIQTLAAVNEDLKVKSETLSATVASVKLEADQLKRINTVNLEKIQSLTLKTDKLEQQNNTLKFDLRKLKTTSAQLNDRIKNAELQRPQQLQNFQLQPNR